MGNHDPLGFTSGAGGIDDVGQVMGSEPQGDGIGVGVGIVIPGWLLLEEEEVCFVREGGGIADAPQR
jgi:hypothetical protein